MRRRRVQAGPQRDLFIRIALHFYRQGVRYDEMRSATLALDYNRGGYGSRPYVSARSLMPNGSVEDTLLAQQTVTSVQHAADYLVVAGVLPATFASWHAEMEELRAARGQ